MSSSLLPYNAKPKLKLKPDHIVITNLQITRDCKVKLQGYIVLKPENIKELSKYIDVDFEYKISLDNVLTIIS